MVSEKGAISFLESGRTEERRWTVKNEFEEVRRLVRENPGTIVMVINHSDGKDSMRMLGFGP